MVVACAESARRHRSGCTIRRWEALAKDRSNDRCGEWHRLRVDRASCWRRALGSSWPTSSKRRSIRRQRGRASVAKSWRSPPMSSKPADVAVIVAACQAHVRAAATRCFANAGVTAFGASWESTSTIGSGCGASTSTAPCNCVRRFVPRMIAAGLPGHVCITGSLAGYINQPGFAAYNASKAAVTALAETLGGRSPRGRTSDRSQCGRAVVRHDPACRSRPATAPTSWPTPQMRADFMRDVWSKLAVDERRGARPGRGGATVLAAVNVGSFAVFPYEPSREALRAACRQPARRRRARPLPTRVAQ